MSTPRLLTDIANVFLQLAVPASLLCLVLAGISLRREGGGISFVIGGGFTKWMFWSVIFLTLPGLLSWVATFGVSMPALGGGISSSWLASFAGAVSSFVTNFVMGRLVTTIAAYFVLRAILDTAAGEPPLPSILAAFFLLGAQTTYNLMSQFNTGSQYATVDVLDSLWTYLASTIMPIAAGLAVVGATINFAIQKPAMRLVMVALAMLSVSGIWYLIQAMAR